MPDDIYSGNFFSIARVGDEWAIWRYNDEDGEREQIILTSEGMDELADWFVEDRDA